MKIFLGEKFDCDLNYQYELIMNNLSDKYSITQNVSEADALVFASTCCCSEETIFSILNYILECISQKKPTAKVYLTGCLTRKFKDEKFNNWINEIFAKYIDYVIPQNEPYLLLQKINNESENIANKDFGYFCYDDNGKIYICNGCLNNCAFCKTSYQCYHLKSVNIEEIFDVLDYSNKNKLQTISLLGTNICQYGIDLYKKPRLLEIIEYIDKLDNIKNIQLIGFSYKDSIQNHFEDYLAYSPKVSYISGSLETGSNRLLSLIRKGFTVEEFIEFVNKIKKFYSKELDLNIISGLPTETIDDIKETLKVLDIIKPYRVNICKYCNSSFLDLNSLTQLSNEQISNNTRIYSNVLTRRKIRNQIIDF